MEIRKRAFTLIELLTATALSVLVVFLLAQTSLMSTTTLEKVHNTSYTINKGRQGFEEIVNDIRSASSTLCKYPSSGTPLFTALDNKVLILTMPVFDASNNVKANEYRVIVYQVSAQTGADGPNVIKRYKGTVTNNVQPALSLDRVVLKNVVSADIVTAVNQIFWGNNSTKEYWLFSTPQAATTDVKNEVLVGGVDRITDGRATLSGSKITFALAPANGVIIDATYNVQESQNVDGRGTNGGTSVFLRIIQRSKWRTSSGGSKSRDVALTARPSLLNKPE